MADLIEREAALNCFLVWIDRYGDEHTPDEMPEYRAIEALPPAQIEGKIGAWIKIGYWGRNYRCNQCDNVLDFDGVNEGRGDANFCPNCGADMR